MADTGELSEDDVERSYRFLLEDPRLKSCPEPKTPLPLDAKRFLVQMYEQIASKKLL